ncbi:MAG: acyl-CoA dehydrogenase family protein [Ilumatobacteraceae bacterium]
MESVGDFRARARKWITSNLAPKEESAHFTEARVRNAQALQARMFDAGLAGITWPREYGGQGLTVEHMRTLDDELRGYETPFRELSVSVGIVGPTLIELGTEQQKSQYLPRLLRGDDLWVQYFSEPTGGSDLAGAVTRATRDGDTWVLNGSKVWTTFGQWADYAMCLARTDWSQPKHAGLSMLIVPVRSAGLTVVPLKKASGDSEFCEEFLEDVTVGVDAVVGSVNDGWNVASRLLQHERNALGGGSPWFSMGGGGETSMDVGRDLARRAAATGRWVDPVVRDRVAQAHIDSVVGSQLAGRVKVGMTGGQLPAPAGSLLKLFNATGHLRQTEAELAVGGPATVAWRGDDDRSRDAAMTFLIRQGGSLAGGSDEIQRNIISERLLGLPREPAPDKGIPYDQVRRNSQPTRSQP